MELTGAGQQPSLCVVGSLQETAKHERITDAVSDLLSYRISASMKIVPLGANVVVKRLPAEDVTAGGIVLPDAAKKKPRKGRVLSIGDGRLLPDGTRVAHQVNEGDRVLFDSYAGVEMTIEGKKILIMSEDDILAILP